MKTKKSKSNSNLFAIFSLLAIGVFYTTDPTLIGLSDDISDPRTLDQKNQNLLKKPKSLIERVGSSFVGSSQQVTFSQWLRTPQAVEAYEKWRKSPTGIKSLIIDFEKTNDFTKSLEKWAAGKKRSLKEFRKFALKSTKYQGLFVSWRSSDQAFETLKGEFIKDPLFVTKKNEWISNADYNQDLIDYLNTDKSKSDYQNWIQDDSKIINLLDEWKKTSDYTSKKNAWISAQNQKLSKDQWFTSPLGQSKYQEWKTSADYKSDLIANYKTTPDYIRTRDQWISGGQPKRSIDDYKSLESNWNQAYQDYLVSPLGINEITAELKKQSSYITSKNNWSNQGRTNWIQSDQSNPQYNAWRRSAAGRESLKPVWKNAANGNYDALMNIYITYQYTPKTKANWLNDDSSSKMDKWTAKPENNNTLANLWRNWNPPVGNNDQLRKAYPQWIAYHISNKTNGHIPWVDSLQGGKQLYLDWINVNANLTSLKAHWETQSDYQTKQTKWATEQGITTNVKAQYDSSPQYNTDFLAYKDGKGIDPHDGLAKLITHGQEFYLSTTGIESTMALEINNYNRNSFDNSPFFRQGLDHWIKNGINTGIVQAYNADAQSDTDYQEWVDADSKETYRNSATYTANLDAWSATKSNGTSTYQSTPQFVSDWNSILDDEFSKTNKHSEEYNKFVTTDGKTIYQDSAQFTIDYNSWSDPLVKTEAKYLQDHEGQISLDLSTYFDTETKKLAIFKASNQSVLDYDAYVNDIKDEGDYLNDHYISDIRQWAQTFDNGKDIFIQDPQVIAQVTRSETKYKESTIFKNDVLTFLQASDNKYLGTYLSGSILDALYQSWKDPVGVERDPEAYFATKSFLNEINEWSGNIINGMKSFQNSTLAQSLFNRYRNK